MVASSIAKAADAAGDAAADADDRDGAPLAHERLPAMAAVAISPPRNIGSFPVLNAMTSLTVGIVLGSGAAVNSPGKANDQSRRHLGTLKRIRKSLRRLSRRIA
jgi:hypothetical protein